MRDFPKSILNYFAAFSETRFRFNKRLLYDWAEDASTLDFSVFPDFERSLLAAVADEKPFRLDVKSGQYIVSLDPSIVRDALKKLVATEFNTDFLLGQITEAAEKLTDALPEEQHAAIPERSLQEGLRQYNLLFRKALDNKLIELQELKIRSLKDKLGFVAVPPSTFNSQREGQRIYDDLAKAARNSRCADDYVDKVSQYLDAQPFEYIVFDLHLALRSFFQLIGTQSVHVFFHSISSVDKDPKYPLFTVEVTVSDRDELITLESTRDVIMLNTPAINSFEFGTVLTAPRACRFNESKLHLNGIERFLQAKYQVSDSFILSSHYQNLVGKSLPMVRYRVGLQAVKDDDRRILDYSELITTLDNGAGNKFIDLVSRYVSGNVVNTARDVDAHYRTHYPRGSAEHLVPKHNTVPIPLNEIQRRILTAAENPQNKIMVVDGPPGTGKSYTITALVYLANHLKKSVVVTSHKRQALDVIDNALIEQFKTLHPQSKPSILRLEKGKGVSSVNSVKNTLSSQAINAALRRSQEFNSEAVERDRERTRTAVAKANDAFWKEANDTEKRVELTQCWSQELKALLGDSATEPDLVPARVTEDQKPVVESIQRLIEGCHLATVSISLDSFSELFTVKDQIPLMLSRCDELNRLTAAVPANYVEQISKVPAEITEFKTLVERLARWTTRGTTLEVLNGLVSFEIEVASDCLVDIDLPYAELEQAYSLIMDLSSLESQFFGGFLKRKEITALRERLRNECPTLADVSTQNDTSAVCSALASRIKGIKAHHARASALSCDYFASGCRSYPPSGIQADRGRLSSLEFTAATESLTLITGKPLQRITFAEMVTVCENLLSLEQYRSVSIEVEAFAARIGILATDLPKLYSTLKGLREVIAHVLEQDLTALQNVFNSYEPLLTALGVSKDDLSTLFRFLSDKIKADHLFRFITLHGELSALPEPAKPDRRDIKDFFIKSQKLLESQTDERFSNLLSHMADVSRLQIAIDAGRRMSLEQAQVLLKNLSCIISEPELISKYFPMEADMIDLLIIDEASQVSIAESISLMLRAKQTIVFGDELQYGAVGAENVSQNYSEYYFKDILSEFAKEQNVAISEEEKDRISSEASAFPKPEDEETSHCIPVSPGTREWLKTFSVRTSTLAFAKALQNYSASLNIHFRSFPEIISYSNDVFYRPSQIELITNRIRTKPIGEVLRFLPVTTKGMSGRNINLDEIDAIQKDIEALVSAGYKGSIGVICSFDVQADRMEEHLRKEMTIYPELVRNHAFRIWFVGDVQGEERDLIYYSFVQDKKIDNADLRTAYPVIGGTADNIRRLKMQRLNVGFSRAKDTMVFVHSMDIGDYSDTRLGDALRHYQKILASTTDHYIEDEAIFDSPAEKNLYSLLVQTPFFEKNRDSLRLIAQFAIGQYIRQEYRRHIPDYRVDFLLTKTDGGKEHSLIIEYDGLEFHTKNPDRVTAANFDQEYLDYDKARQLELESYGYSFLRINKFSLTPTAEQKTPVAVLDRLLRASFPEK